MCNIVSENPRTREKKPWKQVQGMGGLRFWDFQVYRTGTRSFSSHMVFLGNFLADPKTRKCHFNNQKRFWCFLYPSIENSTTGFSIMWVFRRRRARALASCSQVKMLIIIISTEDRQRVYLMLFNRWPVRLDYYYIPVYTTTTTKLGNKSLFCIMRVLCEREIINQVKSFFLFAY